MTIQDAMSLIYPTLCAVLFTKIGMLTFYWWTSRGRMVASAIVVWIIEFFIILLLALSTGSKPPLDIIQYRHMVTIFRFFMLLAVVWSVVENVIAIRLMIDRKNFTIPPE